jgi:hypothetical protein
MEKKVETRKKVMKIVVWVVVIAGLLLTMHILVNNFQILEALKKLHGG